MWEKVESKTFGYCYNQGNKSDVKLFEEFVENNKIEFFRTTVINGPLYDFMKNGGIDKAGGNEQTLSSKIPNVEHSMMYKNADNQILIVSNSYSDEEKIKEDFDNWNNGKYKLTILGTKKSWYYPGATVLFVVTLKDVEVK